ncbi:MAG: 3-oxoacyl-ACP synthase [Ilumatobacter coccineus]|uniref:Beta-ketoacyl-[acyl-carrier-protein] synthase III n=1 Tax=Ilumatobacter coccineus TaxID=467094 RepID=A0A2G6K6W5_9ACTN|nr:MAG: 3-oxoacyl-ACP synthase [Ilumatobacter coccineus]
MAPRAVITGWGKCDVPVKLTNHDLEQLVDTNDQWIVERTGIKQRGINHLQVTDMAEVAARQALAAAGCTAEDIDLLVLCTITPEITCPSNACVLQERLGAVNAAAFDLNAACSGFVYGVINAASLIAAGVRKRILVVGADQLHWVVDYYDRNTCILFGDGAGAVVLEASDTGAGFLGGDLGADGGYGSAMTFEMMGTRYPISRPRTPFNSRIHFEGQTIFKIAVKAIVSSMERALDAAGLSASDIDFLVPHQANERIIRAATSRLGIADDQVIVTIADQGNTSAASVPMALNDAVNDGRITPGSVVAMTAFGGGVTWASAIFRWGDRVEPIGVSDAALAPTELSVLDLIADSREFFAPAHTDD